ncbi:MAG: SH3 domain-containing protein, partial [Chloroflexota bacterium]
AVATVAFDTTGERAVSGAQNGSIIVWDMTNIADENRTTSRILQRFLNAHDDRIVGIAFSPTGDQVVTSSEDGTLRLWDTDRGIELRRFAIDSGERFTGLDVTTSGQTVLTGLSTGIVQEWRLLPQPADLLAWMGTFRFVKEPDCTERARFQIEPLCVNDEQQAEPITLPTLTPGTEVPETLLAPGDMAVINMVTDESLFVRSEPSLSANPPVSQLYDGDQVLVLDGPVQADNLTWWRIRMADGTEGWSAERLPEEAVQAIVPLG